jgi:hypothetical protein
VLKLLIGRHKAVKTLIDNGASLNIIMRKTFIEMCLNLSDLTPVHDMFHGVIPGQSSTPIERINLEVSYETRDNKHREMLTFEVASFNIGYKLHSWEAFPPEVYGSHPHCLCHYEDAWPQGHDHHQG